MVAIYRILTFCLLFFVVSFVAVESHAGGGKATSGEDGIAKPAYVELEPMIIPIIGNNNVYQMISFSVVIEATDEKNAEKVKNLTPRIQDAYIHGIYGMLNRYAMRHGGQVDTYRIKRTLNDITIHVVGEGVIKDVLISNIQQRRV